MNPMLQLSKQNLKNLRKIFPSETYLNNKKRVFTLLTQGTYDQNINDMHLEVINVPYLKDHLFLDKFLLNYVRATHNQIITTVRSVAEYIQCYEHQNTFRFYIREGYP